MNPKTAIIVLAIILIGIIFVFGFLYFLNFDSNQETGEENGAIGTEETQTNITEKKEQTVDNILEIMQAAEKENPTQDKTEEEKKAGIDATLERMKAAEEGNASKPQTEVEKKAAVDSILERMKAAE